MPSFQTQHPAFWILDSKFAFEMHSREKFKQYPLSNASVEMAVPSPMQENTFEMHSEEKSKQMQPM